MIPVVMLTSLGMRQSFLPGASDPEAASAAANYINCKLNVILLATMLFHFP
jgi:hypothetical protein